MGTLTDRRPMTLGGICLVALLAAPLLPAAAQTRDRGSQPSGRRVQVRRLTEKVRPTPTAPKMSLAELRRVGIEVWREGSRAQGQPGRLIFKPSATRFDKAEARRWGLTQVQRQGQPPALRTLTAPGKGGAAARPRLYPRRSQTLASSYVKPARGRVKIAFFDVDGTLRVTRSGNVAADHANDVALLPGAAEKISSLARQGYLVALVSNQGGVASGFINRAIAESGLRNTARLLSALGAPVHYYDLAPGYGKDRKPGTGMATRLARRVHSQLGAQVDWKGSIMVGDAGYKQGKDLQPDGSPGEDFSNSDRRFAENVRRQVRSPHGMKFYHPRDLLGWQAHGVRNLQNLQQLQAYVAQHPQVSPGPSGR